MAGLDPAIHVLPGMTVVQIGGSASFFLGVDGGGTKTRFILVDGDGKLAAAHEGPTSDHLQVGIDGVRDVLAAGLAALFRGAGMDGSSIAYAFFGIPAYG